MSFFLTLTSFSESGHCAQALALAQTSGCGCFVVKDVKVDFDFMPYLANIYQCTLMKLRATDIDQEVKERAITCM